MTADGRPYRDPYLAGVALGLVLLAAFVLTGRGLGASGAFASTASGLAGLASPSGAAANPYFAGYLADGPPWTAWLVWEVIGVIIGGMLSARLAGRWRIVIESGPRVGRRARLLAAAGGGALMGIGAVLARGCTSGQALTGGALLSVGSWAFMLAAFAAGFAGAPLLRRLWT